MAEEAEARRWWVGWLVGGEVMLARSREFGDSLVSSSEEDEEEGEGGGCGIPFFLVSVVWSEVGPAERGLGVLVLVEGGGDGGSVSSTMRIVPSVQAKASVSAELRRPGRQARWLIRGEWVVPVWGG